MKWSMFGFGLKTTLLGLGEDNSLSSNKYVILVKGYTVYITYNKAPVGKKVDFWDLFPTHQIPMLSDGSQPDLVS